MSAPIAFLDVLAAYAELRPQIDAAVARVLQSGCYIGGEEVERFESDWAAFCEARQAIGVGNGLDALRLALLALDIGPGDEVIVPSNTFIATWLAVAQVGAVPVPVEPDPSSFNLDATRIEAAITPRTRAIMPVHLYGQPAELDPILAIARRQGLRVIEDAAQAHGARYRGRRIGAHGDAVAWSFYPGKNLGAIGDGGAITTDDVQLAERLRKLRNYGSSTRYVHEMAGVNSRLDPIQAAVLSVKLAHLDEWNARRSLLAARYRQGLRGMTLNRGALLVPQVSPGAEAVWHLFVVRHPERDTLRDRLAEAGIGTLIHYPTPPHRQGAFASMASLSLPISERLHRDGLSLPIGPHLSLAAADRVIEAIGLLMSR